MEPLACGGCGEALDGVEVSRCSLALNGTSSVWAFEMEWSVSGALEGRLRVKGHTLAGLPLEVCLGCKYAGKLKDGIQSTGWSPGAFSGWQRSVLVSRVTTGIWGPKCTTNVEFQKRLYLIRIQGNSSRGEQPDKYNDQELNWTTEHGEEFKYTGLNKTQVDR